MSKPKVPKEPLTPKGVHRLLVDVEKKGDLRGAGIRRVLTKAIEYGMKIIAGSASDVEIEAFWSRLYLVFTEIEEYHRKLDAEWDDPLTLGIRFWERMRQVLGLVLETHDALRKVIGVDDLVLIDLRRHAACHVAVDGNQIHLVQGALQDKRMFPVLRVAAPLTVEQQDAHVRGARPVTEIANSAVPLLKVLLGLASPLHTPVEGWSHNRVHAVQEDDGTWAQIAGKAGVDLKELLQLNDRDDGEPLPTDRPQPGTVILMPEPTERST